MEQGPLDESTMEDLDPMNYGHYPKPKEEALNYMVKELTDSYSFFFSMNIVPARD